MGITALELAEGTPPRWEQEPTEAMIAIAKSPPPQASERFSPAFRSFVAMALEKDPTKRATAKQLLCVLHMLLSKIFFFLFLF
jgi:serine/threonine protein kinase